jgi:hypothetical protein
MSVPVTTPPPTTNTAVLLPPPAQVVTATRRPWFCGPQDLFRVVIYVCGSILAVCATLILCSNLTGCQQRFQPSSAWNSGPPSGVTAPGPAFSPNQVPQGPLVIAGQAEAKSHTTPAHAEAKANPTTNWPQAALALRAQGLNPVWLRHAKPVRTPKGLELGKAYTDPLMRWNPDPNLPRELMEGLHAGF